MTYTSLFGLAYDRASDKLYAVDQLSRKLLKLDRSTGRPTVILTLPSGHDDIRGLAWRQSDGKLYYSDDASEAIYRVDPATGKNEFVLALADGPSAKVDELDFFAGRLFASYREYDPVAATWSMQLLQIDVDDGDARFVGPVIDDCSAHSLLVNSIPENVQWVQVGGPAPATILRPRQLDTPVLFPQPGSYVFELRATGDGATTSDQVAIRVMQGNPAFSNGGVYPAR
jgi:hypothetical protein